MMPEVTIPDWDVLQQLPGYQVVLRSILKSQIKQLIEQLSCYAGEEAILLSASVSDGALSHIGSKSGEVFLDTHEQMKAEFLGFCMKRHQTENPQKATTKTRTSPRQTSKAKKRKLSEERHAPKKPSKVTGQRTPVSRASPRQKKTTSALPTGPSGDGNEHEQDSGEWANEDCGNDDGASDVASVKDEDGDSDAGNEPGDNSAGAIGGLDVDAAAMGGLDTDIGAIIDRQVVFSDGTGIVVKQEIQDPESMDPGLSGFQLDPQATTSGAGAGAGLELDMGVEDDDVDEDFKPGNESDDSWDQATEKTKKKKDNPRKFLCTTCGTSFKYKRNLSAHEKRHTGTSKYVCCGKPYYTRSALEIHRCQTHFQAKNFACSTCGKRFSTNYYLQRHMRRERKEFKYKCDLCGFSENDQAKMADHKLKHEGGKRHTCATCGKSYRFRSGLSGHTRKNHKTD